MNLDKYDKSFGVMFHHFHNENHPKGQGAIAGEEFEDIIIWLKNNFQIVTPEEYTLKHKQKKLSKREICLTFDDSLLCQFDIAFPILENHGLKAFFNVYSSAFSGNPDPLEVYRYFRTVAFGNIEEFYETFFLLIKMEYPKIYKQGQSEFSLKLKYMSEYPFYSPSDKLFRFFRDEHLGRKRYYALMDQLLDESNFDRALIPGKVFMSTSNLITLQEHGHKVGLHSDTHPTNIASLSKSDQEIEYQANYDFLVQNLDCIPDSMAHPCGKYDSRTLDILESMGVQIGFVSNMVPREVQSKFCVPREDHMTILGMTRAE